jgi:ribosomal protein S12 methylthiotransferase
MKLYLESLGCARNQVDSEIMLGRLKRAGWTIVDDPEVAEAIVVNTCSFIEDAADESIETILELAEYKKTGSCSRFVVVGCLPERYREEILQAMPEVDVFLGTGAFGHIVKAVGDSNYSKQCLLPDPDLAPLQEQDSPRERRASAMAYLKIAEGCSKSCTYCIIPKLRGKQKSRPVADIMAEARGLIADGVKELVLVAQDTTAYGQDLSPKTTLGRLIKKLARLSDERGRLNCEPWLRVLYGHPDTISDEFLKVVVDHPSVCSYFDVPVQHVSRSVLRKMGRSYNKDTLLRLFDRIRSTVPDASLRTTMIVGFPGETNADFKQLLEFAEKIRFDHLGVFIYSDAEDLPSHRLGAHVDPGLARERYDQLMSAQMDISARNTRKYIGQTMKVLVEENLGNHMFAGRTAFQAPEVDGVAYINTSKSKLALPPGGFAMMRVTDAMEYDLMGEV